MKTPIIITLTIITIASSYSLVPTLLLKKKWKKGFNKKNQIMLTFDDGPDPKYTMEVLDLLLKYKIRASFFVISNHAKENIAIIQRMQADGHTIGVHSTSHKSSLTRGSVWTQRDLAKSIQTMQELGVPIDYYRPPWGQLNLFTLYFLKKYKKKLILWNIMAEDWTYDVKAAQIEERLLSRTRDGDIICLHDGRGENEAPSKTIEALDTVIPAFLHKGYQFITVGEYYGKQNV